MDNALKNMFKKAPTHDTPTTEGTPTPAAPRKIAFGVKPRTDANATQSDSIPSGAEGAQVSSQADAGTDSLPKPTSKLAGFFPKRSEPSGGAKAASDSDGPAKLNGASDSAGNTNAASRAVVNDTGNLDSLADLAAIDVSDTVAEHDNDSEAIEAKLSHFDDEFPASKPMRELPDDLTGQGKAFVEMLDGIYDVVHDSELLGGMLKNVMMEFQENPQFESLIHKDDLRAFVVAARKTSGLARIKKTEAKAKRGSGAASRSKSKAIDEDMLADLKALEGL